jgi:hypothetical protein
MRIVSERLHNQRLSAPQFQRPVDVVRWMGAVQAQDYYGAKWALALRMRSATGAGIEKAFNDGQIIRTHLLRPTWHFVAPEDIRWLLQLTGPRVNLKCGSAFRRFELDAAVFKKSHRALINVLKGGKHLARTELRAALDRAGVATGDNIRFQHILIRAELDGIICSGPRQGKQFTYALLDERVARAKSLTRDEALVELTRRYFSSHGPANLQDFVWWSGLTTAEARSGIASLDSDLRKITVDEKTYYSPSAKIRAPRSDAPHPPKLLPAFDEYNVAYKDRGIVNELLPTWNALGPTVIVDGKVVGTWKASVNKSAVAIDVSSARALTKPETTAITAAAERYAAFLGISSHKVVTFSRTQ